jgi:isoquinoline 1-oxidoreductase subunit beta
VKSNRRRLILNALGAGASALLPAAASFRVARASLSPAASVSRISNRSGRGDNRDISLLATPDLVAIGAWILIARSGAITLLCNQAEMGQGVSTALAILLAEELEVALSSVQVRMAPPATQYNNPRLSRQLTGESASVRGMYTPLREAGAQVRDRLLRAAAQHWHLEAGDLIAKDGMVRTSGGRSLSYGALALAASRLPARQVPLKAPATWVLIGQKVPRIDTASKVNGSAIYGIDVRLPGLLHAAIRMGPVLGAKVRRFNDRVARARPGVIDIVSTEDGVAAIANNWWIAHLACALLEIEWDNGESASQSSTGQRETFSNALTKGQPLMAGDPLGNVDEAMRSAHRVQTMEFWSHSLAHATMEPMNFTAHWDGRHMRLIGPTQYPQSAQAAVAAALSIPVQDISVQTTYLGCGFGRRVETDVEVQAAKISFALKRPVKLLWSREEDMTHGFYRPVAVNRMQIATDRQGLPVALDWMISSQSIKSRIWGWDPKRLDGTMVEYCDPPYRIANTRFRAVHSDAKLRVGFMRSVSHAFNVFANEGMIDELAKQAGRDSLDYRLGLVDPGSRYERVLKALATLSAWHTPTALGRTRGMALMYGYGSVLAMVCEVSLTKLQVQVHRVCCALDAGQVVNAAGIVPQIESSVVFGLGAALMQEITFERGQVRERNFDTYPLPTIRDMPKVEVEVLHSAAHPGGIGEPGAALVQAATANAVSAALNRRVQRLPMTSQNLKKLMA